MTRSMSYGIVSVVVEHGLKDECGEGRVHLVSLIRIVLPNARTK